MDPKRILREDVEFGFNFFFIIAQGRWKQKPIRKSIRASHITYAATALATFLLFY